MKLCTQQGCTSQVYANNLCRQHYNLARRRASGTTLQGIANNETPSRGMTLKEIALEELQKPLLTEIAPWVLERLRLPEGEGVDGDGRVSFEAYSHMEWMFEQIQNPEVEDFVLCCSAQFGKSVFLFALAAYYAGERGMSGIYILPTKFLQESVPKTRLGKTLERSGIGFTGVRKSQMEFERGNYMRIALASSPATLAEMPAKFLIFDELDEATRWDTDPVKLGKNRLTTAKRKLSVLASTPKLLSEQGIYNRYNNTKRYVMEQKCPHCAHWFHSLFDEHFRWPENATAAEVKAGSLAWIECPECGGEIRDKHQGEIIRNGQRVVCLDPDRPNGAVGLQGRKWEVIWTSYSEVVAEYLDCVSDETRMRDFYNSWLATPQVVELKGENVDLESLKGEEFTREKKQIPAWVQSITAGVDIDTRAVWVVLYGWGEGNRTTVIHDAMITVHGPGQEPLEQALRRIHDVCDMEQFDFLGKDEFITPSFELGCIDAGFETDVVYDWCRVNSWWQPVKGGNPTRIFEQKQADPRLEKGGKYRGLHYWLHNTHQLQEILHRRLLTNAGERGSISFAKDQGRRLFEHFNAVKRVEKEINGRLSVQWQKKSNKSADHLRDACANAELAGRILGLENLEKQILLSDVRKTPPPPQEPQREWKTTRI